ncbi:MAG TPA: fused MFS/spermidine synthase [Verrucomicrobiae bacterium]
MLPYAVTIFLGAFLLFQVQPLMGKFILPWFGGGPGVWTTCMLFFQVLLLGGYAYAHWLTQRLKPKAQAWLHVALLVLAVAALPVRPGEQWKPPGDGNPVLQILALLAACIGLPYFVLSSTGPLIQHWFHRQFTGRSPYRLYALSNLGSLLALISYPFAVEPLLTRKTQASVWGIGLVLFVAGCAWCALRNLGGVQAVGSEQALAISPDPDRPGAHTIPSLAEGLAFLQKILWVLLPATASVLLLATTNKICQDVAVIPFLWIVPLSLYLLSFILCFDSERWYRRAPFTLMLVVALTGICWALYRGGNWPVWKQLSVYCSGLFICCMVCHGEVYRLRPAPEKLTGFYLGIATGGALGGLFVAVGAPLLFANYYELHWGLFACAGLLWLICVAEGSRWLPRKTPDGVWLWLASLLPLLAFLGLDRCLAYLGTTGKFLARPYMTGLRIGMWAVLGVLVLSWIVRQRPRKFAHWRLLACLWLFLGLGLLGGTLWSRAHVYEPDKILTSRNFYGVLTVYEHHKEDPKSRHVVLQHGRITHGLQFVDEEQATWPTSYYAAESGVGLALDALSAGGRRIGLVGLGTGSLAVYAKAGDYLRIYEINPQVITLATSRFSYLRRCAGKVEIKVGDARLSMEREPAQQFDLLALDAFSGDAIPAHLLTREAFELYGRHLKTNGVIAVHISNHFLDLEPVVLAMARQFNYGAAVIDYDETTEEWWLYSSTWVLLTRDKELLQTPAICAAASPLSTRRKKVLWTDDFTSLLQVLK